MTTPAVGAYLLPVQTFRVQYALQVLAVIDCADSHAPGIKQLQCRRWGLDAQRQPVDDGHCDKSHNSYYTGRFPPVGQRARRVDTAVVLAQVFQTNPAARGGWATGAFFMSATIDRRITELEQFRERQERRRTGPKSFVDEVAEMLQGIDGQADLGMLPGENLTDVMARRMQSIDGFDLSGMPGDTLKAKRENVEEAYFGRITVTPAARHAARSYFKLYDYV